MSDWSDMLQAARAVDRRYQALDRERLGRIWSLSEFLAACATDWGELAEQVLVQQGLRPGASDPAALRHELADLLWALMVISDRLEIDLGQAFMQTMSELERRLDAIEPASKENAIESEES